MSRKMENMQDLVWSLAKAVLDPLKKFKASQRHLRTGPELEHDFLCWFLVESFFSQMKTIHGNWQISASEVGFKDFLVSAMKLLEYSRNNAFNNNGSLR